MGRRSCFSDVAKEVNAMDKKVNEISLAVKTANPLMMVKGS